MPAKVARDATIQAGKVDSPAGVVVIRKRWAARPLTVLGIGLRHYRNTATQARQTQQIAEVPHQVALAQMLSLLRKHVGWMPASAGMTWQVSSLPRKYVGWMPRTRSKWLFRLCQAMSM